MLCEPGKNGTADCGSYSPSCQGLLKLVFCNTYAVVLAMALVPGFNLDARTRDVRLGCGLRRLHGFADAVQSRYTPDACGY